MGQPDSKGHIAHLRAPNRRLSHPTGAIVLGGDYRGLGIVRSLGRRNVPVWVIKDHHTVAAHSRYAERVIDWTGARESEYERLLENLGSEVVPGAWALFPTTDQMTALVARNCDQLAQAFAITTAPPEVVDIAQDKRRTHALAAANGLGFPRTWLVSSQQELESLELRYPVILKPAVKDHPNPLTRDKAWRVEDRSELFRQYQIARRMLPSEQIMIQDLIPGDGRFQLSYAGVMSRGAPVADVVAKRLRQYPADFGLHSTYVMSVEDPEVEAAGRRIVEQLGYSGLIEIEFKRDPRDLSLNLLDINTRVWGWHTLGLRSGIDFIHVNWRVLQGEKITPVRVPQGETWVRLLTDSITSFREIRRGRISSAQFAGTTVRRHDGPITGLDDPVPILLDAPMLAYLRWKRVLV